MAPKILLLPAVLLPPRALEHLGEVVEELTVETPWGAVGPIARREAGDETGVYILPYSGSPTRLDPRGTVWAAKSLGVQRVLTWERAIGLEHGLGRGDLMVPDDFIDWTHRLPTTIFADRGAGYLQQVPPFCPETHSILRAALQNGRTTVHGGVYLGVDGPRRETPAEASMYRRWGAAALGMNVIPEVVLAKELELCYGVLCTVTAMGSDRPSQPPGGEVRQALRAVLRVLPEVVQALSGPTHCRCGQSQAAARGRGILPSDWREWATARTSNEEEW